MRSSRWTTTVRTAVAFELRDRSGRLLGETGSHAEAIRMFQAYVLTSPGVEDDVFVISLDGEGREITREDLLDIEFGR